MVIPLLSALYDIDYAVAAEYVVRQTREHRASDHGHLCEMPETNKQILLDQQVTPMVRKLTASLAERK